MDRVLFQRLAEPFPADQVDWFAKTERTDEKGSSVALALAYIDARTVMNRLDETMGPENWQDEYRPGPGGGILCRLSLRIDGEWITKEDGADPPQTEEIKGGFSDAFKRAAVKWGVGRYLYDLPKYWVKAKVTTRGNSKYIDLLERPTLPGWALPGFTPAPSRAPALEGDKKPASAENGKTNPARPFTPDALKAAFASAVEVVNRKGYALGVDDFNILESAFSWMASEGMEVENYLHFVSGFDRLEDLPEPECVAFLRLLKPSHLDPDDSWIPCQEAMDEAAAVMAAEA